MQQCLDILKEKLAELDFDISKEEALLLDMRGRALALEEAKEHRNYIAFALNNITHYVTSQQQSVTSDEPVDPWAHIAAV